jgi:hypothetical protein
MGCSTSIAAVPRAGTTGTDRWDSQRPLLAVGFGNPNPADRTRTIRLDSQFLGKFAQPSIQPVRLKVFEALAVHSFCATIGFAAGVGVFQNITSIHLVVQGVKPLIGRCLGFGVQRRLQLLKLFRRR